MAFADEGVQEDWDFGYICGRVIVNFYLLAID